MHILVVDDEIDVKSLFEQRFRKEIKENIITLHFEFSGESALEYLTAKGTEAVIILSDINMPGMSGIELLKEIKTKPFSPSPVVIMITAYGDEENHNLAIKNGADDFLTKPIDFGLLKQRLLDKIS
jgi:two-component system, chemotaxis family, chemotaxis protein CheY